MTRGLAVNDIVEFIRYDIAGKTAQVKKIYSDGDLAVLLLPDGDEIEEAHRMVTSRENVRKI